MAELTLLYGGGEGRAVQIVKLDDEFYYYGDGLIQNSFSWTPEVWLRNSPYFPKAKEGDRISDDVLEYLEVYADEAAEKMKNILDKRKADWEAKEAEKKKFFESIGKPFTPDEDESEPHVTIWMDAKGNVTQEM